MRRSVILALIIFNIVMLSSSLILADDAIAKIDSSKKDDIHKLMILTDSGKLGIQVLQQLIISLKKIVPDVPDKFWDELKAEVNPNDLIELCVPIYDKYLTHDDIKELIKFSSSPVGKKLTKVQPRIVQESMEVGNEWGAKLGEQIVNRLKKEGYFKDR